MLSTVHASEVQFRLETELRARESLVRALRRERQAGIAAEAALGARRPRRTAWPRPIGVAHGEALPACA